MPKRERERKREEKAELAVLGCSRRSVSPEVAGETGVGVEDTGEGWRMGD